MPASVGSKAEDYREMRRPQQDAEAPVLQRPDSVESGSGVIRMARAVVVFATGGLIDHTAEHVVTEPDISGRQLARECVRLPAPEAVTRDGIADDGHAPGCAPGLSASRGVGLPFDYLIIKSI